MWRRGRWGLVDLSSGGREVRWEGCEIAVR